MLIPFVSLQKGLSPPPSQKSWLQIYKRPKIRNSQPHLSRWPIQKKRADRRNKIKQKTRDNIVLLLLFSLVGKEQEKISAFYKLSCNPLIITISLFCDKNVPLGWPWFWQEVLPYDRGHIGTLDAIEKTFPKLPALADCFGDIYYLKNCQSVNLYLSLGQGIIFIVVDGHHFCFTGGKSNLNKTATFHTWHLIHACKSNWESIIHY